MEGKKAVLNLFLADKTDANSLFFTTAVNERKQSKVQEEKTQQRVCFSNM